VPGTTLCGPSALVHISIGDTRDDVVNLREPLDEGAQRFLRTLLDDMVVGLIAWPRVSTVEVGRELVA
jgi:hypothetical protein